MTGNSLSHLVTPPLKTQSFVPLTKLPEDKLPHSTRNENRVDELLRAFSDVAYTSEEKELPWESWNYSKIAVF